MAAFPLVTKLPAYYPADQFRFWSRACRRLHVFHIHMFIKEYISIFNQHLDSLTSERCCSNINILILQTHPSVCCQGLFSKMVIIWGNSQIPECTGSISHNAPFRTEMYTFLFWMGHCGIWNRCIMRFVKLVYRIKFHCQSTWIQAVIVSTSLRATGWHYGDVIMGEIASQITSPTTVYSTVYSNADQRKHQSFASLAFVRGIHRGPMNSPHRWPVTQKMLPFDDVIMGVDDDWNLPCCFTRPKRVSVTYYSIWLIKLIRRCFEQPQGHQFSMMTSSNGNIFRVAGPLCEEFTGQRWNPRAHKGQWRAALMFSLICARINGWVNNREAGDLRRHCAHYDITVMLCRLCVTTISDTGCLPNTGLCVSCFR